MAKKVETRPEWLKAGKVAAIYSVSGCISKFFCDYIDHWKHNGYWFFDAPALIAEVAQAASTTLAGHQLFYYEVYEKEFEEEAGIWTGFAANEAFATNVVAPATKRLEGYDVVTFSAHTSPECSPLSCNHLAAEGISVNRALPASVSAGSDTACRGARLGQERARPLPHISPSTALRFK